MLLLSGFLLSTAHAGGLCMFSVEISHHPAAATPAVEESSSVIAGGRGIYGKVAGTPDGDLLTQIADVSDALETITDGLGTADEPTICEAPNGGICYGLLPTAMNQVDDELGLDGTWFGVGHNHLSPHLLMSAHSLHAWNAPPIWRMDTGEHSEAVSIHTLQLRVLSFDARKMCGQDDFLDWLDDHFEGGPQMWLFLDNVGYDFDGEGSVPETIAGFLGAFEYESIADPQVDPREAEAMLARATDGSSSSYAGAGKATCSVSSSDAAKK